MTINIKVQATIDLIGRDGKEFDGNNPKKKKDVLKVENVENSKYPHTKKVMLTIGEEQVMVTADELREALERVLGDGHKIHYYPNYYQPYYTYATGASSIPTMYTSGAGISVTGGMAGITGYGGAGINPEVTVISASNPENSNTIYSAADNTKIIDNQ